MPFAPDAEKQSMLNSGLENVIVLLSISKIFGIPGLRIGFVIADESHIQKFRQALLPWSVNSLAQESVRFLSGHKAAIEKFILKSRAYLARQREQIYGAFKASAEFSLYRSQTPFLLIRLPAPLRAEFVWERLAENRILIRNCTNFEGLSDKFIRVSLKTPEANRRVAEKLMALSNNQAAADLDAAAGQGTGA